MIRYLVRVLASESMPVWMTLLIATIGVVGTYFAAPLINAEFQKQTARREFLVSTITNLDSQIQDVLDITSTVENGLTISARREITGSTGKRITAMQLSLTQLTFIIPEEKERIENLQIALNSLQRRVILTLDGDDINKLRESTQQVLSESLYLYDQLMAEVGFRR